MVFSDGVRGLIQRSESTFTDNTGDMVYYATSLLISLQYVHFFFFNEACIVYMSIYHKEITKFLKE